MSPFLFACWSAPKAFVPAGMMISPSLSQLYSMAATTGPLTAVLTADCRCAMRQLPFGSRAFALLSRGAGSAVMDAGRISLAETPELLLTKTSKDFLRAPLRHGPAQPVAL